MKRSTMPTHQDFNVAGKAIEAKGYTLLCSVMADDAKKEGVENFGRCYMRDSDGAKFWLNFKTIDRVSALV
jgi:hypothetical protein